MRFRIPDFPLGALFASIMATVAILFAFPDLADGWLWWALVFVACIAWAIGAGLMDSLRKVETDPEAPESDDTTKILSANTAALVAAINRQERANRAQERREDNDKRTRDNITIFVIAVTAGAIILQVSEMKKVYGPIKDQADATKIAQRAWVVPMKFVFDNLDNSTDPLRIAVYFQNVGREPARDVRDWTSYAFVRTPLSPSELRENTYLWKDDTFRQNTFVQMLRAISCRLASCIPRLPML